MLWFAVSATGRCGASHFGLHPEMRGEPLPLPNRDMTDWDRVKREQDSDAQIPYNPNDPNDPNAGPYGPNDEAAVEACFAQATIDQGWPNPLLIQRDGVPVHPDGTPRVNPSVTSGAGEFQTASDIEKVRTAS